MNTIRFTLNDQAVDIAGVAPTTTLLEYLRLDRGMVGTKEGCAEGDCGACTVVMVDADAPGGPTFRGINSCLVLLPLLHGKRIYTVEALKDGAAYHIVQEALVEKLGSQCGYCTPGIIMSMFEACYRTDLDAAWKLDDQMCGNLCRCTGYRPIREATQDIAGKRPNDRFVAALKAPADPQPALSYHVGDQRFFVPTDWGSLFDTLDAHPDARLICGATDLGLDVTQKRTKFPTLVSLQGLSELRKISVDDGAWSIGATVTLADLEDATDHALPPLSRILRFFGSRQIKNRATVGGNLSNASPIGDLAPVLLSLGATAVIRGRVGERKVPLDAFFVGYRKTALKTGEILARIEVPAPASTARMASFKVTKRREMDISAVAAGIYIEVEDDVITTARVGFGGMAATPARAAAVEAALVGQAFIQSTFDTAAAQVDQDFTPMSDHRGSAWYRATVAANYIRGFFAEVQAEPAPRFSDRPSATLLG